MNVFERRKARLKELLLEFSAAELHRRLGVSASYLSRCLLEPDDKGFKNMGELTARKLEEAARKREGWLDNNSSQPPQTTMLENNPERLQSVLATVGAMFRMIPEAEWANALLDVSTTLQKRGHFR